MIKIATTDDEILKCFGVMNQLRPNLHKSDFVDIIKLLFSEGYILAYLEEGNDVKSVAGFKEQHNLFLGKHLYVEDFVTDEKERSKSYGQQLFDWLCERGRQTACSVIHLDSGVQRYKAHKFYLNQDLKIICYHFGKELISEP